MRLIVPYGWSYTSLDDCVELMRSGLSRQLSTNDIGLPVLRSNNMGDIFSNSNDIKFWHVDDPQGANTNNYVLDDGDILVNFINSTSQIGKVCIFKNSLSRDIIYTTNILRLKLNGAILLSGYLLLLSKTERYRKYIQSITKPAINQASFTTKEYGKFQFLCPPVEEQLSILSVLKCWDHAIDLTERLLAEKRLRRKGLMQQLLTGKRRLPGYSGKWQEVHLGDIFKNRTEAGRTDLPLVSITAERGVISRDEIDRKDSSSEDKGKYLRICPGDIGYNTMRMWQGVSGLSSLEGIVSPAYTIVTPKKGIDGEFMAILFKFPPLVHLFYRYSQGLVSDTWNLKFRHFAEIKVTIPAEEEQKAIAKVFRVIDRELGLLQAKADALREQKKGLMQQLLTGKIRVCPATNRERRA